MNASIELDDLHVRFGDVAAVDGVTCSIPENTITGLLGRNGAGKTTLLSTISAYRRPSAGTVRIGGLDPYERAAVVAEIALVPAARKADDSFSVHEAMEMAALLRPRWDAGYADRLLDLFGIASASKVGELSTGLRSALSIVIGLASRSPVTLFDEPHLGMDAPARYAFYEELLNDSIAHPRTIVFSTHLIDEVSRLLEDVIILDRGRLIEHEKADVIQSAGAEVTGPTDAVIRLIDGRRVLSERRLGRTSSLAVLGGFDERTRSDAVAQGIDISPLPLQDLFIHLTSQEAAS